MGRKRDKRRKNGLKQHSNNNNVALKNNLEKTSFENDNLLNNKIDIIARLNFPFLEPNADIISKEEEEDFEFSFRPRTIFAYNLCLVCMEVCDGAFTCENCQMVSYCSDNHRKENLKDHRNLCKILTQVCKKNGVLSLAKDLSPDEYRIFRVKLIEIIEQGMKRKLDLWEKEIILYPRLCRQCHSENVLIHCPECKMDFYCSKDHQQDHNQWCNQFKLFQRIIYLQKYHGSVTPKLPNRIHKEANSLPQSMDDLISDLFSSSEYYKKMDCHSYASLSHIATIPLTTLLAIQKSLNNWQTMNNISIHVIGAEFQFECWNFRIWEKIFLHHLPNLKTLSLTFTGPELQIPEILVKLLQKNMKICQNCRESGRQINVNFNQGKLYHEIDKNSLETNVVCLFNPGLYRQTGFNGNDTWPLTIKKFTNLKIPVLITAYTEREIPQDIATIKSLSNIQVIMEPQKNPFASLKPDRNFVSDDAAPLMYKNQFLSIIKVITNTIDSTDYCYFPISNQEVHLSIQTSHDARISLRTHLGEDSKVYEIALGERENTISSIKVNNHESSVSLVETRDILNEEEERSFWLRWKWYNGVLSVGHEGCEAFMSYRDKDPFIINYIGISTAHGATGSWVLDGIQTQCLEIRQQLLDTNHYWMNYNENLGMPRNAVTVSECGSFVGRAQHEGSVTPGNIEGDICTLSWGGSAHNKSNFQVLCGKTINWIKSWDGSVPLNALPGGETEDNYPLFIGRVFIDGMYYAGKIQPNHQVCYIPHCGIEKAFKEYETLVVNCYPNIEWVGR